MKRKAEVSKLGVQTRGPLDTVCSKDPGILKNQPQITMTLSACWEKKLRTGNRARALFFLSQLLAQVILSSKNFLASYFCC